MEYGLRRLNRVLCVYVKKDKSEILIVAIYMDDLLILSNHDEPKKIKKFLNHFFEIKILKKAKRFLGFEIHQNKDEIRITQKKYIEQTLLRKPVLPT